MGLLGKLISNATQERQRQPDKLSKKNMEQRQEILDICEQLREINLIKEIENRRHSIYILFNYNSKYKTDAYRLRDMIKNNFEKKGYVVDTHNWWIEIFFINIEDMINECFEEDSDE